MLAELEAGVGEENSGHLNCLQERRLVDKAKLLLRLTLCTQVEFPSRRSQSISSCPFAEC